MQMSITCLIAFSVFNLIACSSRDKDTLFDKNGIRHVYLIDTGKGFGSDQIEVDLSGKNIEAFEISETLLLQIESARSVNSYWDMSDGFALPLTIIFVGRENRPVAGGLIYYRSRLKKSFLQLREISKNSEGRIVIGSVLKHGAQQDADGLEMDGNYEKLLNSIDHLKATKD
jgi:hypothetical protein